MAEEVRIRVGKAEVFLGYQVTAQEFNAMNSTATLRAAADGKDNTGARLWSDCTRRAIEFLEGRGVAGLDVLELWLQRGLAHIADLDPYYNFEQLIDAMDDEAALAAMLAGARQDMVERVPTRLLGGAGAVAKEGKQGAKEKKTKKGGGGWW